MAKFSEDSLKKLGTCHKDLQVIFEEVVKTFDCSIIEGHRGEKAQEEAFKKGLSKLHYPKSKHNSSPSMAVDANQYPIDWKNKRVNYDIIFFAGYVMGVAQKLFEVGEITHKVRWGGDWNQNKRVSDETFLDFPHFELVEVKETSED